MDLFRCCHKHLWTYKNENVVKKTEKREGDVGFVHAHTVVKRGISQTTVGLMSSLVSGI